MAEIDKSKLVPYGQYYDENVDEIFYGEDSASKHDSRFKKFRKKMKDKYKVGNFLTQDFPGLLRQVPKNYVLVKERPLRGGVRICRNGHPIFIAPWTKRTLISLAGQVMHLDYNSTIGSIGEVQVKLPITLNWRVSDDDTAIEKFYSEPNAVETLKSKMYNYISKVVASYPHDKLKDINIKFSNPASLFADISDDVKKQRLIDVTQDIINEATNLGIVLDDINFKDADYPKEVADAYNESAAMKIKKDTELEAAVKDVEIETKKLEVTKIKNEGKANLVSQLITAGMSPESAAKTLERLNLPVGAQVMDINGCTGDKELLAEVAALIALNNNKTPIVNNQNDDHTMGGSRL